MKTYTIGREETCNVIINDPTQMVSRVHATLQIRGGKMTITDDSSNGTYINGIRITAGTPVPVSRKDVVTFAQVAELDWKRIPNASIRTFWTVLAVVFVLCAAGFAAFYFIRTNQEKKAQEQARVEETFRQLQARADTLAVQVGAIGTDLKACQEEVEELNALCAAKNASKLTEVNKLLGQLEETIASIDLAQLEKSMDSIRQSVEDGSNKTEERVVELEAAVASAQDDLLHAKELTGNIRQLLAEIPNVRKPAPVKKEEPSPTKEEEETPAPLIF